MTRTPVFALPILFALSSPAFAQLEQVQARAFVTVNRAHRGDGI